MFSGEYIVGLLRRRAGGGMILILKQTVSA